MKVLTSRNKQTIVNKFKNANLYSDKKKNVKGGNDPIGIEDYVIG